MMIGRYVPPHLRDGQDDRGDHHRGGGGGYSGRRGSDQRDMRHNGDRRGSYDRRHDDRRGYGRSDYYSDRRGSDYTGYRDQEYRDRKGSDFARQFEDRRGSDYGRHGGSYDRKGSDYNRSDHYWDQKKESDKQRKGSHLKEEGVRKSEHWEGVEETDGDVLVESTGIKMADKSTKQNGEVGVQQRTPEKRAQPPPSPNRYLSEEGYSQRPPDHASSRYNEPGYDRWANLDYDRRSSGPVGSDGRYDKGGRYSSYDRRGTYPSYGIPSYQRSYSDSWGSSYGRGHIDWETPLPRNERLERYICIHIHI